MHLFTYQIIMQRAKRTVFRSLVTLMAVLWVGQLCAQSPPEAAPTRNRLEKIEVVPDNDNIVIRLDMQTSLAQPPTSFSTDNPARISMDFQNLENGLGKTVEKISQDGPLTLIQIIQAGPRVRMIFNLSQIVPVETRQDGNSLVLTFRGITLASSAKEPQVAVSATPATKPAAAATPPADEPFAIAVSNDRHIIRNVTFRRGSANEGRILITLSDAKGGIDIRRENSKIIVNFLNTSIAADLQKKLDVLAYGTPVSDAEIFTLGGDTRMVINSRGLWEHSAYQADNRFVLEIKPIKEDPYKLVQGSGVGYQGERLSLSFQNIAVRDLLKVIADFTSFNILTSNAVTGNLTLRLKDVPWDQALDIILQTKGLDKRKDGNVIWIGSQAETLANDRLQLEAVQRNQTLEPLRTEVFQLNYQTGKDVVDLLRGTGHGSSSTVTPAASTTPVPGKSLLSARGGIIADERTNKLFITDTQTNLEAIRRFLKEIDLAPKQVAIEARIVETSDSFRKNLGARVGVTQATPSNLGGGLHYSIGGNLEYLSSRKLFGNTENTPDITDTLMGNLAAPGIDNRSPGQFALSLFNKSQTKTLNLELTALQADGKGYVVSNPRVVTANQVKALVKQGIQIPYQKADSGGSTTTSFLEAVLSLDVTPQITPDGRVRLTLAITKNTQNVSIASTGGLALDAKAITTEVMVDNGGTLVIGGIFEDQQSTIVTKVPLLGDIPIIGNLFKVTERNNTRSEMLILITPRILSEEAAS